VLVSVAVGLLEGVAELSIYQERSISWRFPPPQRAEHVPNEESCSRLLVLVGEGLFEHVEELEGTYPSQTGTDKPTHPVSATTKSTYLTYSRFTVGCLRA